MAKFSPYELDEYVLHRLSLNKKITLECEIEENKQLFNEIEKRKKVIEGIRQIGRESLLELFESWDNDINAGTIQKTTDKRKRSKEFSLHPVISYAIVIVIIGIVVTFSKNYNPTKNFTTEKAFAFYFEPMSTKMIFPEKDNPEFTQQRKAALAKYEMGDYESAIIDMNEYLLNKADDAIIHMFSGIAYLAMGQNETSIQRLKYAGNRDNNLLPYTNWFIALAYLNTEQMDDSREYLQRVAELGGFYSGKARELYVMSGGKYESQGKEIEQF